MVGSLTKIEHNDDYSTSTPAISWASMVVTPVEEARVLVAVRHGV